MILRSNRVTKMLKFDQQAPILQRLAQYKLEELSMHKYIEMNANIP